MKNKSVIFNKYLLIGILILNSVVIIACFNNTNKIKSHADAGMGYWIKVSDSEYKYKISKLNKEKIFKEELKNIKSIRNSKILLGIMYITDINSSFITIENSNFGVDLQSKDTLITGRDEDYLIVFEEYKTIYFPISISIIKK